MKALIKPVLAAGLILATASPLTSLPVAAQAVKGVGVIDPNVIISQSSAFVAAEQQRPETYKQYYEQAQKRRTEIEAQLQPLITKLQTDSQAASPDKASLQQQISVVSQIEQQSKRELTQILAPVVMSQDYVDEQITEALPTAIRAVADKTKVSLILNIATGAVVYRDASYDLNTAVINELNAVLPVAQLVPPPGWLPKEYREAQERAAVRDGAADGAAAPAPSTPAGPAADSR